MEDLKTYSQWCSLLEAESGMKIIDNDGGRALAAEKRLDALLTKSEAYDYFYRNTIMGVGKKITDFNIKKEG